MKSTVIRILLSAGIVFMMTACIGDLDVKQKAGISNNEAWESAADAEAAVNGGMNLLRAAFSSSYIAWGEFRTGLWGPGRASEAATELIWKNQINPGNAQASWKSLYNLINQANLILKYAPGIEFNNEADKNRVIGSGYYLRALSYYWIVRLWGDAPLCLEPFESDSQEGIFPFRAPKADILARIESDLVEAKRLMTGTTASANRPNIDAVNVLMTDYYLWMYKVELDDTALAKARTSCDDVLGNKSLLPAFADIFNINNKLNGEVIFALSMVKDEKEGGFAADWLVPIQYVASQYVENPVKVGSHQQWSFITDEYKALFNSVPGDTRKDATYQTFYDDVMKTDLQWMNKYAGLWENSARSFCSDIIVYRYADVLLFDAEIKCYQDDISGAVSSLNEIAERAYGVQDYYEVTDKETVLDNILTERLKEFCAEGKLWWDYIRMGVVFEKVPSLKGKENNKNILLWPVSQSALNLNENLEQTVIEY